MMVQSGSTPQGPASPGSSRGRIEEQVAAFAARVDEGTAPEIETFCRECPEEIRRDVASECRAFLAMRDALADDARVLRGSREISNKVLGEFRIRREIGRGGMGVVYLAEQPSLGREVALKVLAPAWTRSKRSVDRFLRESRRAAALRHPGLVPIHAVGEAEGAYFFAMEYVEGKTLAELIEEHRREGRFFDDPARLAELVRGVAEALHYCHEAGVLHRDVKPQNILVDVSGKARLLDFGLAKELDADTVTHAGEVAGTNQYMSPEQARGSRDLDARSDVYSLAVVLYELLSLRRPTGGSAADEVLARIDTEEPRPIRAVNPRVPRDLETVCLVALEKRPQNRYESAAAFAEDLGRFLGHEAIVARPPSGVVRAARFVRARKQFFLAASVILAVVLLAGITGAQNLRARERIDATMDEMEERLSDEERLLEEIEGEDGASLAMSMHDHREKLYRWSEILSSGDRRARAERLLAALGTFAEGMWERGKEALRRGEGSVLDVPEEPGPIELSSAPPDLRVRSALELQRAHTLLRRARMIMPELPGTMLDELDQSGLRLSSDEPHPGACIVIRRIDRLTNRIEEERRLESGLPAQPVPLVEGHYRIVITDGSAFAEIDTYVPDSGIAIERKAFLRPTGDVTADMVFVDAGEFPFRMPVNSERACEVRIPMTVKVEPFWIDPTVVSNEQYETFLLEQGYPEPWYWLPRGERPADWARMPVTGVSLEDARAYASWAGKRLPTLAEWLFATRDLVREIEAREDALLNARGVLPDAGLEESDIAKWLADQLRPVDDDGIGGRLHHVLGNVWEWTETPSIDLFRGRLDAAARLHMLVGGSFVSVTETLRTRPTRRMSLSLLLGRRFDYGFRCVKTDL